MVRAVPAFSHREQHSSKNGRNIRGTLWKRAHRHLLPVMPADVHSDAAAKSLSDASSTFQAVNNSRRFLEC